MFARNMKAAIFMRIYYWNGRKDCVNDNVNDDVDDNVEDDVNDNVEDDVNEKLWRFSTQCLSVGLVYNALMAQMMM